MMLTLLIVSYSENAAVSLVTNHRTLKTELAMEVNCFQTQNLTNLLFSLTVAVLSNKASTASTFVVVLNLRTNSKVFARIRLAHVLLCQKRWKVS